MSYRLFFSGLLLVLSLMTPVNTFAEEPTSVPDTAPVADPSSGTGSADPAEDSIPPIPQTCQEVVEKKFGDDLSPFFLAISENPKKTYETMTSAKFRKNLKYVDFEDILSATGLANPSSREWLYFDDSESDLLRVTGAFIDFNNTEHTLHFIFKKNKDQWQLDLFSESPVVTFYRKAFPQGEALKSFVQSHIHILNEAFQKKNYNQFFKTFLQIKTIIRKNALRSVFSQFRKAKLDVSLPENASFVLEPCSSVIDNHGVATVKGSYKNEKFTVTFRFEYIYQWAWKMKNFNFSVEPVKKAEK